MARGIRAREAADGDWAISWERRMIASCPRRLAGKKYVSVSSTCIGIPGVVFRNVRNGLWNEETRRRTSLPKSDGRRRSAETNGPCKWMTARSPFHRSDLNDFVRHVQTGDNIEHVGRLADFFFVQNAKKVQTGAADQNGDAGGGQGLEFLQRRTSGYG